MTYLKQIFLASLVLSVVVLTAGVAAAEVGIPFGLKWGDSPETVEETCKKLFGEYTKKAGIMEVSLEIESEIDLSGYKFRMRFSFNQEEKLASMSVSGTQTFEDRSPSAIITSIAEKYFLDPFDSLPSYKRVRIKKNEILYFTPNSRITVMFGPVHKSIDKDEKSALLFVTWEPLNIENLFIE